MSTFGRLKRRLPIVLTAALSASLAVTLAAPQTAFAGEPSVQLPTVASVASSQPGIGTRDQDEASKLAIRGNQSGVVNAKPGAGSFAATSLSASATWQVSGQTGDFSWSYPFRVTPAPGGVTPTLGLSYSSSAVDGLTSATNNQASWIGDGWSLWPGFIERTYGSCKHDLSGTPEDNPSDLCWKSDNATMSLNGSGSALIRNDADGRWRPKNDDGSRVERIGSPHDRNESWKVTTVDGTQFFFGSRPESKSVWKVPVYGDDDGEPCHQSTFAASSCDQHYRWSLDKVVSRTGDMMVYNYETETNTYGRNKGAAIRSYDRSGYLTSVEYGLRADRVLQPSGRVVFEVAERCLPNAECSWQKPENMPDVPLDLRCDDGICKDKYAPSFWTTKRLAKVTTEARVGDAFKPVDSWTLRHEWPDPGDGEKAAMWLAGVTHTGHTAATAITLPEVTFEGARRPNRVYTQDGYSKLIRFRMNAIVSETGGITGINYAEPECAFGTAMPANAESNTMRCFPAKWSAPNSPDRTDYFHKYVVSQVTSLDRIGSTVAAVTSYVYPPKGVAWHYDESEFTPEKDKTWSSYRGYGDVTVLQGNGSDSVRTKTRTIYYRGMHGDKQPNGTRDVQVRDSEGGSQNDENWLQGQVREVITYPGDTDEVVSKSISLPYFSGPTAVRGPFKAYIVRPGSNWTITPLKSGGRRETRSESRYDENDETRQTVAVNDLGDLATAADDKCVRTEYDRKRDQWLMKLPARVETVAVNCDTPPTFPEHAISDVKKTFDAAGNLTELNELQARPATGAVHATIATTTYDVHGRVTEVTDALGRKSKASFSPDVGGPVVQSTTTDANGFTTVNTLDPLRGTSLKVVDVNGRKTETAYDAMGRVAEVWSPDRDRSRRERSSVQYTYSISRDAPIAVTTTALAPRGNYLTSTKVYDGLLRLRQTQEPTQGGRLLTDTRYDSHGRAYLATKPFFNNQPVDGKLWEAKNLDSVPAHTVTQFDGAGRSTAEIFMAPTEKWRSTTSYDGDRVHHVPPPGGAPTTTVRDARGAVVSRQATSAPGVVDTTSYAYHADGTLAEVTDPGGNKWKYFYDLRGRLVRQEDPDKGRQHVEVQRRRRTRRGT